MRTSFNHQPEAQPPNLPARRTGEPQYPICSRSDFVIASLEIELVALRHQVTVLRRQRPGRPRLGKSIPCRMTFGAGPAARYSFRASSSWSTVPVT